MKNKLCTKRTGKSRYLGATLYNAQTPSSNRSPATTPNDIDPDDDDWEEYIDNLHLPDTLPGQHFHINFGFVRSTDFKVPTEKGKGPTLTSIDAKNSYCLIVDHATRFMWVHLSNTKQPPTEPVRMVLRKVGNKQTTHQTV